MDITLFFGLQSLQTPGKRLRKVRYDAVRAAYSSLDSRSVSCRATEMLGRALVAQTFVTASLGAVFSLRIRHRLVQRLLTQILQ